MKDYQFITRAEALERMRKKYPELTADLPTNPLPASYEIAPRKAEEVKELSAAIRAEKFAGVERVKDGQQTSKRILQVARVIEVVFLVAVIVLLIASVLLIANTIRLSIFSRRREIEVMKLVGATNWFVRGPFMVEGLLCGLAGALIRQERLSPGHSRRGCELAEKAAGDHGGRPCHGACVVSHSWRPEGESREQPS